MGPDASRYSSGSGSHDSRIVAPYVQSVTQHVASFGYSPNAVDLGCGDFAIGALLRPLFNRYIACDIVTDVLAQNRLAYADLDVDFRLIDITADDLPPGDLVFVRQVLQHLSNEKIGRALEKLVMTYSTLILTEHLPRDRNFTANIDIETGPGTRLDVNSGVDITLPPFSVKPKSSEVLCEVAIESSIIRTMVYHF